MKKSNLIKPVLFSLLMASALTACNSGAINQPNKMAPQVKSNLQLGETRDQIMQLGGPLDRNTPLPFASAIDNDTLNNSVVRLSNQYIKIKFDFANSLSKLSSELGLDAKIDGTAGGFSGSVDAKFHQINSQINNSLQYSFGTKVTTDVELPTNLPKSSSSTDRAGNGYAYSGKAGIAIQSVVSIEFKDDKSKQEIEGSGKFSFGSMAEINGSLNMLKTSGISGITVHATIEQLGGDPSLLGSALKSKNPGVEQYPGYDNIFLSECNLDNIDACIKVINAVQEYTSDDVFNNQIKDYLSHPPSTKYSDLMNHLYMFKLYTIGSSYKEGTGIASKALTNDEHDALDTAAKAYTIGERIYAQWKAYSDTILTSSSAEDLKEEIKLLADSLDTVQKSYAQLVENPGVAEIKTKLTKDTTSLQTLSDSFSKASGAMHLAYDYVIKVQSSSSNYTGEYLIPISATSNRYMSKAEGLSYIESDVKSYPKFLPNSLYKINNGTLKLSTPISLDTDNEVSAIPYTWVLGGTECTIDNYELECNNWNVTPFDNSVTMKNKQPQLITLPKEVNKFLEKFAI